MNGTFQIAVLFNQSLSTWDVRKVVNMSDMFRGAKEYNHPLLNWDIRRRTDMDRLLVDVKLFKQRSVFGKGRQHGRPFNRPLS